MKINEIMRSAYFYLLDVFSEESLRKPVNTTYEAHIVGAMLLAERGKNISPHDVLVDFFLYFFEAVYFSHRFNRARRQATLTDERRLFFPSDTVFLTAATQRTQGVGPSISP